MLDHSPFAIARNLIISVDMTFREKELILEPSFLSGFCSFQWI